MAAALYELDVSESGLQGVEQGYGLFRNRIVVPPLHGSIVGIRPDQGNFGPWIKRKDAAFILQEDHGLPCHLEGECPVFRTFYDAFRQRRPRIKAIDFSEADAGNDDSFQVAVELGFGKKSTLNGLRNCLIGMATFNIHTMLNCDGSSGSLVFHIFMPAFHEEVGNGPGIRNDHSLVAPFPMKYGIDQVVAGSTGLSLETVVGSHYLFNSCFGDKILECREIGLIKVAPRGPGIEAVTFRFRT